MYDTHDAHQVFSLDPPDTQTDTPATTYNPATAAARHYISIIGGSHRGSCEYRTDAD